MYIKEKRRYKREREAIAVPIYTLYIYRILKVFSCDFRPSDTLQHTVGLQGALVQQPRWAAASQRGERKQHRLERDGAAGRHRFLALQSSQFGRENRFGCRGKVLPFSCSAPSYTHALGLVYYGTTLSLSLSFSRERVSSFFSTSFGAAAATALNPLFCYCCCRKSPEALQGYLFNIKCTQALEKDANFRIWIYFYRCRSSIKIYSLCIFIYI